MQSKIRSWIRLAELSKLAAAGLVLIALAACGNDGEEPVGTPTAPPGMFSTLPTTEPPAAGDQAPTIELNTPEPTLTPNPTPHTKPDLHAGADVHALAIGHSGTHGRADGYPGADTGSHAQSRRRRQCPQSRLYPLTLRNPLIPPYPWPRPLHIRRPRPDPHRHPGRPCQHAQADHWRSIQHARRE